MGAQIPSQRLDQLHMFVSHTFMDQQSELLQIPLTRTEGFRIFRFLSPSFRGAAAGSLLASFTHW
jgi:hypothetical protein